MGIENYTKEKVAKMSLINIAKKVMLENKKAMKFSELYNEVAIIKGLNEEEKRSKMSQFYTDLNADGGFIVNASNQWILKRWYRNGQTEEVETN